MKLKYISTPSDLGGTAVAGCGTIHKSEIKATLTKLSDDLELPFDLNDYTLGSTGKRTYSGDIDLVIDTEWWGHGIPAFRQNLEVLFGKENVARNGDMLHLKYPIVDYKADLQEMQPRTGFVQIDFNFGNAEWERFYHFSPGDKSAYKGAHRNLAIAAISSVNTLTEARGIDHLGRCVCVVRWKFGSNGFIKVRRESVRDARSGDWMKKQVDTVLEGPILDAGRIVKELFSDEHAIPEDLESLETIMVAVDKYCGMVERERIWRRMAHNFFDWSQGKLFEYPPEIAKYIPINDK